MDHSNFSVLFSCIAIDSNIFKKRIVFRQRPKQKKRKNYNIKYRKNNLEKLLIKDRIYSKNVRRKNPIHKIKENLLIKLFY